MSELVMVQVTDHFGDVESEPLVITRQGQTLRLDLGDEWVVECDLAEFVAALETEHDQRRAA